MHELICRENTHCFYFLITARAACAGSAAYFHFPLIFLFFYVILLYEAYLELCSQQGERVLSEL